MSDTQIRNLLIGRGMSLPMLLNLSLLRRRWLILGIVAIAAGIAAFLAWKRPQEEPRTFIQPLPYRLTLLETLAAESTLESIDNLPNFDDVVWVDGVALGSTMTSRRSYRYSYLVIPKLNRVRKVLQEGRAARDLVVPKLKEVLARSLKDFDKARQQDLDELNRRGSYVMTSPNSYMQATIYAPAATYLLEELDAFDTMPQLCQVYHLNGDIPVHRLFLGFAIHLLATRHPRDGLSQEARVALDDYLKAAKDVPAAKAVDVPAWNATMTETDFRVVILGQDIGLSRQPQVRLNLYPHALCEYEDYTGTIQVTFDPLVEKMTRFVALAYGPRKE